MKPYRRLLKVAQPYWLIFLLGVLATVVMSLIDAGLTWLIKPIINHGFVERSSLFIQWLPVLIIVIFLARSAAGFASVYFVNRVARNVVRDLRRFLFAKMLRLPANYLDQNNTGHLLSTVIYNVEQVSSASALVLLTVLRDGALLAGLVFVMFSVSWQLSLMFFVIAPLIALVVSYSGKRMRRLSNNVQQSVGEVTRITDEAIGGYKVIRLCGGYDKEMDKFFSATKQNQQRDLKVVSTNSLSTSLAQLLMALPIAVTLAVATLPSLHISAGSFAAVMTAMVMLLRPVRRLTLVNSEIQKGIAGASSIFALLDETEELDQGKVKLLHATGQIYFDNVTFHYPGNDQAILHNVTFEVRPGQRIAIVGRSGGGKSTLVNLLPRFYDVSSGQICLDGQDIRHYRLQDLREQIAMVSQNTMLFNDTIANNITYGLNHEVSQQELIEAASAANAMEFIESLPKGFATIVGEDGVLLSGGQRQRIAIARALIKKSSILILDEATSALDSHSERHIQQALNRLLERCTSLVIAHRLSTIENADWILVLDKGRIVEQGTHAALLAKEGAYAALYRLQFKKGMQTTVNS